MKSLGIAQKIIKARGIPLQSFATNIWPFRRSGFCWFSKYYMKHWNILLFIFIQFYQDRQIYYNMYNDSPWHFLCFVELYQFCEISKDDKNQRNSHVKFVSRSHHKEFRYIFCEILLLVDSWLLFFFSHIPVICFLLLLWTNLNSIRDNIIHYPIIALSKKTPQEQKMAFC